MDRISRKGRRYGGIFQRVRICWQAVLFSRLVFLIFVGNRLFVVCQELGMKNSVRFQVREDGRQVIDVGFSWLNRKYQFGRLFGFVKEFVRNIFRYRGYGMVFESLFVSFFISWGQSFFFFQFLGSIFRLVFDFRVIVSFFLLFLEGGILRLGFFVFENVNVQKQG